MEFTEHPILILPRVVDIVRLASHHYLNDRILVASTRYSFGSKIKDFSEHQARLTRFWTSTTCLSDVTFDSLCIHALAQST